MGNEPDSDSKKAGAVATLEEPAENLEKILKNHEDKKGVLLKPESKELAVLNCSIPQIEGWPKPFLYRAEIANKDPGINTFYSFSRRTEAKKDNIPDPFGRYSMIKLRWLKSPTEFTDDKPQTILFPTEKYETGGVEDPRTTLIGNVFYITYVAFDGINSCVALATTKDFKKIEKHRIISPQISLEECIELVKDRSYKDAWAKRLKGTRYLKKNSLYPMDKDAFIMKNSRWELFHRLGNFMQISRADRLEDFQDQDYWREQIKNIEQSTVMKNKEPYVTGNWASEKVGWGSDVIQLYDKQIAIWHGVDENKVYRCSFLEIKDREIVSIIKDPLIIPEGDDTFLYHDEGQRKTKQVLFATAGIVDKTSNKFYIYMGSGDIKIKYYVTNARWLYHMLNDPHNRIEV